MFTRSPAMPTARSLRAVDDGTGPALGPPPGARRPSVSSAPAGSGANSGPVSGSAGARHQSPASGLLGPAHARRPAFIYTEADIAALIEAARRSDPATACVPAPSRP